MRWLACDDDDDDEEDDDDDNRYYMYLVTCVVCERYNEWYYM